MVSDGSHRARRRRHRVAPALLCLPVALAACTSKSSNSPPGSPAVAHPAAVVSVPAVLNPASIAGLVPHQDSTNESADRRSVSTVFVPGDPSLNLQLTLLAHAAVRTYAARLVPAGPNELNVGWDLVLAAGTVLGLRVRTSMTNGSTGQRATTSVYADLHAQQTWTTAQLLAEPALLAQWVAAVAPPANGPTPTSPTGPDLRFAADGSLTVVVERPTGELAVRISPAAAVHVLSTAVRTVRAQAMARAPFTGLPAVPAVAPAPQAQPIAAPTGQPQGAGTPVDCAVLKCLALTFDDGPGPYTEQLLAELHAANVLASFFLVGQNVASQPGVVRDELAAGHYLANHTWDHSNLTTLTPIQIAGEIDRTADAIQAAAGVRPTMFRPPYGATNTTVDTMSRDRGLAEILWNVDTEDWKTHNGTTTTQRVLAGAQRGAIVLMHDIQASTVPVVPAIITALKAAGYTLVTIPQLIGTDLTPGQRYYSA